MEAVGLIEELLEGVHVLRGLHQLLHFTQSGVCPLLHHHCRSTHVLILGSLVEDRRKLGFLGGQVLGEGLMLGLLDVGHDFASLHVFDTDYTAAVLSVTWLDEGVEALMVLIIGESYGV